MWRIAQCVYRAFRNTATHRCSQDILVPLTTVYTADDDSNKAKKEKCAHVIKNDLIQVIKNNQFTYSNIEKLEEQLKVFSLKYVIKRINILESTKVKYVTNNDIQTTPLVNKPEETLDSVIQADEHCKRTVQDLADLHEETMSIVNLQIAIDALESGDFQFGIETLENCAKNGTNAAALYNLGICYERGIGVEQDREKACNYYRQASILDHPNAQLKLTFLSNQIDMPDNDDNEEETIEQTTTEKMDSSLRELFFQFLLSNDSKDEQSINDYPLDFKNRSIVCLS